MFDNIKWSPSNKKGVFLFPELLRKLSWGISHGKRSQLHITGSAVVPAAGHPCTLFFHAAAHLAPLTSLSPPSCTNRRARRHLNALPPASLQGGPAGRPARTATALTARDIQLFPITCTTGPGCTNASSSPQLGPYWAALSTALSACVATKAGSERARTALRSAFGLYSARVNVSAGWKEKLQRMSGMLSAQSSAGIWTLLEAPQTPGNHRAVEAGDEHWDGDGR